MCDCSSLPDRWWAEGDSDQQAEKRGWQQVIAGAFGWAVLWQCRQCGQYWEGYVTCGTRSPDCVAKFRGSQSDWSSKTQADYDRFIRENRLDERARQLKREFEREGYNDVGFFALYSPWDDLVPWKAILAGKKKRWLGGADEKQIILILARNGDVCPISDTRLAVQISIGHTKVRRVW
jgi:hypothetical protein